jgi:Ferritin-like domain
MDTGRPRSASFGTGLDRASFLRRGVAGLAAMSAAGLLRPAASGAADPIRPVGEDIGFVQWGATAELVSLAFYDRALHESLRWGARGFSGAERTRLKLARATDAEHLRKLRFTLQSEAPDKGDFTVALPDAAFRDRRSILDLGLELETLIAGVYLDGVTHAGDPGTRALLGRLLASESQHISALRVLGGQPATTGLLHAVYPEQASDALDRFVQPGPSAPRAASRVDGG